MSHSNSELCSEEKADLAIFAVVRVFDIHPEALTSIASLQRSFDYRRAEASRISDHEQLTGAKAQMLESAGHGSKAGVQSCGKSVRRHSHTQRE